MSQTPDSRRGARIGGMHEHPAPPRHRRPACTVLAVFAALAGCAAAPSTPAETAPSAPSTVSAPTAAVAEEATLEEAFARWVASLRAGMQAQGIDEATLRAAFDDVHYLPRVVELDRAQPEFTRTIWDYLDRAVTPQRIARGQDKLQQVRDDGRRSGRALRRAAHPRGGDLGHREQLRRQHRQHADHRCAGDAGIRRSTRGLGTRAVVGGAEDPAKR